MRWRASESPCCARPGRPRSRPPRPARDRALEALVFDVAGSPAEFSADLLIRLAGSAAVADPDWKRELLEIAFRRAYGVQEPYKRTAPNASVDSRAGGFTRAYATGLDALTLQVRAALAMLPVDPVSFAGIVRVD